MSKVCTICKIKKSISEFHKSKSAKNGLKSECKECGKNNTNRYRTSHPEIVKKINDKQYAENSESIKKCVKRYRNSHAEECNNRSNNYIKNRSKEDINFRIARNLRTRIYHVVKGQKSGSAVDDLGCTVEFLRQHLESQFQPRMTWENYGKNGWEIDHIYPLSKLDLTDREQFLKACHYTNMQPLWAADNLKKSNKVG